MTSWQYLELDTTAPTISLNIPSYTTRDILNYIEVISNEKLALSGHEVYIIDTLGNRFNLNLSLNNNILYGYSQFNDYSIGPATLYAKVLDEVNNISNIQQKTFNIIDTLGRLKVNVSVNTNKTILNIKNRKTIIST